MDSKTIPENPLYAAWKSKSFTDKDIMLHFFLPDLLKDNLRGLTSSEAAEQISLIYQTAFDSQTVRLKLREYERLGIFTSIKKGRELRYFFRPTLPMEDASRVKLWNHLMQAVSFYQGASPFGIVGSTLLDREEKQNRFFQYKHQFLVHTLEDQVLMDILSAIHQKKSITISFLNGSAWSYNLEDEVSMKSQLQDPTVKNSGIAYMYKPVYEKSKTFHRKIFSDFRNKYYSKRNVDKVIIDTKNRYETETFQIDGYTIKVKASIDISNLGISQASKVDIYAPKKEYLLGENINIDKVNNYDIPTMINAFITDLKYYFSQDNKETTIFNKVINGDIISKFKSLEGNTIALAKGYKDDNRVEVLIDPVKWKNSSSPKRWYILYHELGHDILNL